MMHIKKVFGIIIILVILVFALSLVSINYLASSAKNITYSIDDIENKIDQDKWSGLQNDFAQLKDKWERTSSIWTTLVDHIEIDNIDSALARLETFIKTRDKTMSLSEAENLKQFIDHIPKKENLNIKNIL